VNEHCVPVVLTVATAEVEDACLKNGLLLHNLLSLASIGPSLNNASMGRIRFERCTEARPKECSVIEQRLAETFIEYPLQKLPSNPVELVTSQQHRPTSWTLDIESILLRSMSFSEAECMSTPIAILFAVSSTDYDHMACLQELTMAHNSPISFKNVSLSSAN
jgi:hypothetical protein